MNWMSQASCHNHADMWAFFADELSQRSMAMPVCRACPVVNDCLDHAIERGEDEGVWGGTLPAQRKELIRRARLRRTA